MFVLGIRANVYSFTPELDPIEFALLAVQHYFIIHGKDIDPEKMKQLVQEILPIPMITPRPTTGGKSSKSSTKGLLSEKQIDELVQTALDKDEEVRIINEI